jgi:transcriptional regulator with XRE-family HTH domain
MINSFAKMEGPMIYKRLRELKEKSGMSVQQIAAKSGVPASTISRILSGQTDSPGCQTLVDLVRAMGGSLDEVLGLKVETPIELPKALETPKEIEKVVDYTALIQLYEKSLANNDKLIKALLIACGILMAVLIIVVLYFCWDVTHPAIGLIQY